MSGSEILMFIISMCFGIVFVFGLNCIKNRKGKAQFVLGLCMLLLGVAGVVFVVVTRESVWWEVSSGLIK